MPKFPLLILQSTGAWFTVSLIENVYELPEGEGFFVVKCNATEGEHVAAFTTLAVLNSFNGEKNG